MDFKSLGAAIVTGGASGLGEATSRMLAANGVKVGILDLNEARGEAVAKEIGGVFAKCDVTNEASVDAALIAVRARNGVERVLVNCAGIAIAKRTVSKDRQTGAFVAHDLASFEKVVQINLIGTFRMIARSAAAMAALDPVTPDGGRGVIVNTASVAATDGQIGQAAYSASKGGVCGITLPIARDLAQTGIRVVTIMPGLIHTPMFDTLSEEAQKSLAASIPFPSRLGKPTEYSMLVRAIIENDMLNGESIRLDGAVRLAPR
jgi:NAD(P)-dependent dehydrogenase (short-subunit alcohol dehydrogenase family)